MRCAATGKLGRHDLQLTGNLAAELIERHPDFGRDGKGCADDRALKGPSKAKMSHRAGS